jgi:sterol desaturase/sphingolipid hydroxylase (fatty acid hydroxylase superfamily)
MPYDEVRTSVAADKSEGSSLRAGVALNLVKLALFMVAASYAIAVLFNVVRAIARGHAPAIDSLIVNPLQMDLLASFLPVYGVVLLVDVAARGWTASSLRRLTVAPSPSALSDVGYVLLGSSGLGRIIGIVAFAGAGLWIERHATSQVGLDVATGWPLWLAVPVMFAWTSFWTYWEHRFWHSRLMWPIHKCHHAALEFTVLTAERTHPFEIAIGDMLNVLVLASLGFPPEALAILYATSTVAAALQHSELTGLAGLECFGFLTPAGHRVHHGREARFHDSNYGDIFNVWDRLFGTYVAPSPAINELPLGIATDDDFYNTTNPVREVLTQSLGWFAHCRSWIEERAGIRRA